MFSLHRVCAGVIDDQRLFNFVGLEIRLKPNSDVLQIGDSSFSEAVLIVCVWSVVWPSII